MAASSNSEQPKMTSIQRLQNAFSYLGRDLLTPSGSKEELLVKLDKLEHLMYHMKQEFRVILVEALEPSREALFSDTLVKHEDLEVRISVAACMSEIIRITAPKEIFDESQMKIFFRLVNSTAYENLHCMEGLVHWKTLTILEILSRTQSCVLMLDHELFDLVREMFHFFLDGIRPEHHPVLFSSTENIMTLIVSNSLDCDELTLDLTKILLARLNKENPNTLPTTFELANKVFENCVNSVKTFVPDAVRSLGIPVACYPDVVSSLCPDVIERDNMDLTEDGMDSLHHGQVGQPVNIDLSNLSEENKTVGSKNDEIITENLGKSPTSHDEAKNIDSPKKMPVEELRPVDALNIGTRIPKTNFFEKPEEGCEFLSSSRPLAGQSSSKRTSTITKVHAGEGSSRNITAMENLGSKPTASKNLTGDTFVKASTSRSRKSEGKEVESGEVSIPLNKKLYIEANEEIDKHSAKENRPSTHVVPAENSGSKSVIEQNLEEDILIKDLIEDGIDSLHHGQVGQSVNNDLSKLAEENKTVGSKNDEIITENHGKSPTSHDETENIDSPKKTSVEELRPVDAINVGKRIPKTNSFKKPEEGYEFLSSSRPLAGQSDSKRTSTITKVHAGEGSSRKITATENMGSKPIASKNLTGDTFVKASTSRSRKSKGKEVESGEVSIPQNKKLRIEANEEIDKHSAKPNRPSTHVVPAENSGSKSVIEQNLEEDILIRTLASKSRPIPLKEEAQPGKSYNRQRKKNKKSCKKKASKGKGRSFGGELVGSRIKVWWPLEKTFFEGKVISFNKLSKTHEVDYDDGDHETLDLTKECWEMLPQDNLSTHEQNAATTSGAAADMSGNPEERTSDHLSLEERWRLMLD